MEQTQPSSINPTQPGPANQKKLISWLRVALIVAFLIAALLTGYLTFITVRDLVTSWQFTDLPGVTILDRTPTPGAAGEQGLVTDPRTPLQPDTGPTPVPWDGASRVTVLLMGLDQRDWEAGQGPPRTDTMVLLTVDPLTRTAGMLSIPRDLWVNIPGGFGYGRINEAYRLGEAYKWPEGGGPGLAMSTVEGLLGVPIDYYAQIDFHAFVQFVDEIGGVKLDIPEKITIDPLGDNNTKTLKPGRQTLPGELALAYARARKNAGDDFGRAQRTQQVILAVRDRILDFNMLPTLIGKSGILYNQLSSGVHTNLNLEESIKLAWLGSQIPRENIKQGVIGPPDQVSLVSVNTDEGSQEVLKPITENIRLLRDEIFTAHGPASPAAANLDPVELMKAEAARVSILNGTATAGLASRTAEYLQSLGMNVTRADNAQQLTTYTDITFYTGKPYTVKFLVDLMKIDKIRIHHFYDPASPYDIQVVLGQDWVNSNTLP